MFADGILYWTPLILDGILTGNFNGKVVTGIHGMMLHDTLSASWHFHVHTGALHHSSASNVALCLGKARQVVAPPTRPSHIPW